MTSIFDLVTMKLQIKYLGRLTRRKGYRILTVYNLLCAKMHTKRRGETQRTVYTENMNGVEFDVPNTVM